MPVTSADKRAAFKKLHQSGCFIIPNPFDVGSARALQHLGFKALASTSAGFAWTIAKADNHVTVDEVCDHLTAICAAVDLPVNADYEGGFADEPEPGILSISDAAVVGVHLTLLRPNGSGKAGVDINKRMIGPSLGSPLVLAPANDLLGFIVSEGIEDGLSGHEATGLGVWAAGSASRLPALADAMPPYADCVTVLVDDDDGVVVKPQKGAVLALNWLLRSNQNCPHDFALFHCPRRARLFHVRRDNVADPGVKGRLANDADHGRHARAGVIRHIKPGSNLHHNRQLLLQDLH